MDKKVEGLRRGAPRANNAPAGSFAGRLSGVPMTHCANVESMTSVSWMASATFGKGPWSTHGVGLIKGLEGYKLQWRSQTRMQHFHAPCKVEARHWLACYDSIG